MSIILTSIDHASQLFISGNFKIVINGFSLTALSITLKTLTERLQHSYKKETHTGFSSQKSIYNTVTFVTQTSIPDQPEISPLKTIKPQKLTRPREF